MLGVGSRNCETLSAHIVRRPGNAFRAMCDKLLIASVTVQGRGEVETAQVAILWNSSLREVAETVKSRPLESHTSRRSVKRASRQYNEVVRCQNTRNIEQQTTSPRTVRVQRQRFPRPPRTAAAAANRLVEPENRHTGRSMILISMASVFYCIVQSDFTSISPQCCITIPKTRHKSKARANDTPANRLRTGVKSHKRHARSRDARQSCPARRGRIKCALNERLGFENARIRPRNDRATVHGNASKKRLRGMPQCDPGGADGGDLDVLVAPATCQGQ